MMRAEELAATRLRYVQVPNRLVPYRKMAYEVVGVDEENELVDISPSLLANCNSFNPKFSNRKHTLILS
ncbi:hypothetical protein J2S13_000012 [Oikeobacillus pervagus]|uniref:Uncharacterized protein n=1 Tax=Oikeobacillus pervagus TaxID=1325931 RepID=A0AAJ1WHS0_9BACI|nr:hypothetical protein [Oikeobacillus pervagus]